MSSRPGLDLAFDERVADQYDAQRRHPPEVAATIGRRIAAIAGPGADVLELGVGTGRIALPVADAGCHVVGVDLSARMLARWQQHSAERRQAPGIVRADVTALPFLPASFDAALLVHVLHLVEDWQAVLDGTAACLRPGGACVLGRDWIDPASPAGRIQLEFRRVVMALGPKLKAPGGRTVNEYLQGLAGNAPETDVVAAEWDAPVRPAEMIDAIADREYAESWPLPDDILEPAVDRLRHWAADTWDDPGAPQPVRKRFLLTVFHDFARR